MVNHINPLKAKAAGSGQYNKKARRSGPFIEPGNGLLGRSDACCHQSVAGSVEEQQAAHAYGAAIR